MAHPGLLVTNSLVHGDGPIVVRVLRDGRDGRPVIEAWDSGEGRPAIPAPTPLLRVYANGAEDIGMVVSVLTTPGGTWSYHWGPRGRHGYLSPCGDAKSAAEVADDLLKHRMYPSTW